MFNECSFWRDLWKYLKFTDYDQYNKNYVFWFLILASSTEAQEECLASQIHLTLFQQAFFFIPPSVLVCGAIKTLLGRSCLKETNICGWQATNVDLCASGSTQETAASCLLAEGTASWLWDWLSHVFKISRTCIWFWPRGNYITRGLENETAELPVEEWERR